MMQRETMYYSFDRIQEIMRERERTNRERAEMSFHMCKWGDALLWWLHPEQYRAFIKNELKKLLLMHKNQEITTRQLIRLYNIFFYLLSIDPKSTSTGWVRIQLMTYKREMKNLNGTLEKMSIFGIENDPVIKAAGHYMETAQMILHPGPKEEEE